VHHAVIFAIVQLCWFSTEVRLSAEFSSHNVQA